MEAVSPFETLGPILRLQTPEELVFIHTDPILWTDSLFWNVSKKLPIHAVLWHFP